MRGDKMFSSAITRAIFAGVFLLPMMQAHAEGPPDVPGDDIFGFTSPTDIGNPGDKGFGNENDVRTGKRNGSFQALNTKYEFSRTLTESWWIAGSLFGSYNHAWGVPGVDNVNRTAFDGLSFEIEHRLLKRSAQNPFAISLSVEPRWGRIDGLAGQTSDSFGAAFKLFTDAVIVPDKLFWGANLQWSPQSAQDFANRGSWIDSSSTLASMALTAQFSPKIFAGVEVRYLSAFDGAWLNKNLGNAFYAGPTLLWRATDKVVLNVTYQPQIFGHAVDSPDQRLDLDNFERAQYRVKLAVTF
jgi:hypothetical protein